MTIRGWNWRDDERLNREYRKFNPEAIAPADFSDLKDKQPVPNYVYDEAMVAYCRLDAECAAAHCEAKRLRESNAVLQQELRNRSGLWKAALKDAARNRRYAIGSTVIAAAWAITAWIGWMR